MIYELDLMCLSCGGRGFIESVREIEADINGNIHQVIAKCYKCYSCDNSIMDTEQMNKFRESTKKLSEG